MKAKDIIEVVFADLQTHPRRDELMNYAELIKYVAEMYPNSEVKSDATAEGLYKAMLENARKNKKGDSYCYSPNQSIAFCKSYLGVQDDKAVLHLNAKNQRLNLEDFF